MVRVFSLTSVEANRKQGLNVATIDTSEMTNFQRYYLAVSNIVKIFSLAIARYIDRCKKGKFCSRAEFEIDCSGWPVRSIEIV